MTFTIQWTRLDGFDGLNSDSSGIAIAPLSSANSSVRSLRRSNVHWNSPNSLVWNVLISLSPSTRDSSICSRQLIGPAAVGNLSGQQEPAGLRRGFDVQVDRQRLGAEQTDAANSRGAGSNAGRRRACMLSKTSVASADGRPGRRRRCRAPCLEEVSLRQIRLRHANSVAGGLEAATRRQRTPRTRATRRTPRGTSPQPARRCWSISVSQVLVEQAPHQIHPLRR